MNKFSAKILKEITKEFPELSKFRNNLSKFVEFDIPSQYISKLGGLVIQTTEDNNIWIRNYQPYSGYLIDNVIELITIIKDLLSDNILWVIEFENEQWEGTTFIRKISDLKTESGITYKILSWSGRLDKEFYID